MVTRTEAIKAFLIANTRDDLAQLYCYEMECQVNVAQDNGERVEGDYKGRQWHGWSDGIQTWKSFRIPRQANTDAVYTDTSMSYDLADHAEGIGMTGWDWVNKLSRWVAFDFDAITGEVGGHAKGLTIEQLGEVKKAASEIPWVTVRHSTSGKGLHLYVHLVPVTTENHSEHAALARAILGLMSAHVGFDFTAKVDTCGGNIWVWHRKMKDTNGLTLVKSGELLDHVPQNWRDHLKVISGKRKMILPSFVPDSDEDAFERLTGQRQNVKLDADHQKLIGFLNENGASFWWDADHHMLVAHTYDLKRAHDALDFKGLFSTVSKGTEHGVDHNCFLFPLRSGAWVVRRYSPGTSETDIWDQDQSGFTRCYLNYEPTLRTAARAHEGLEDEGDKFIFRHGDQAVQAAQALGANIDLTAKFASRAAELRLHKDGKRLIVEVVRDPHDTADEMRNWLPNKKGDKWKRIFDIKTTPTAESETLNYDDVTRHLICGDGDYGWVIKSENDWHDEPLVHVRAALDSTGLKPTEIKNILGGSVFKPWMIVNRPFQPQYPGDRTWNRNAAQLKYLPNLESDNLSFPTWLTILTHIGQSLDNIVLTHPWAKENGLKTGADYLKCWIASLFQEPTQPLPYLFLHGPQGSGKSVLHEALSLLLTSGYQRADAALTGTSGFNAEIENAVLCVVEETDLRKNQAAYNKIKDWVTSLQLLINCKYKTPYHIENTTHWIQCSNDRQACPVFMGDTRITMCYVGDLTTEIPKRELMERLIKEAPDFLGEVLKLEIPRTTGRLNIPVLESEDKTQASKANQTMLELYLDDCCYFIPGAMTPVGTFFDSFTRWLEASERYNWTKIKVSRDMPTRFPKGRSTKDAQWNYGNLSLVAPQPDDPTLSKLVLVKETLRPEEI